MSRQLYEMLICARCAKRCLRDFLKNYYAPRNLYRSWVGVLRFYPSRLEKIKDDQACLSVTTYDINSPAVRELSHLLCMSDVCHHPVWIEMVQS